jgi:hypothetical protein
MRRLIAAIVIASFGFGLPAFAQSSNQSTDNQTSGTGSDGAGGMNFWNATVGLFATGVITASIIGAASHHDHHHQTPASP